MITEALLEMHFFRALAKLFELHYGGRFLRILKPSTNREAWLGFDQGWVPRTYPPDELERALVAAVSAGTSPGDALVGFFLQFKVVQRMVARSKYCPEGFITPYYRCELSLEPNSLSGLSQHDTLVRLCSIPGASVNYACPMLFDIDDVLAPSDLDRLQIVEVSSSPKLTPGERHFISFQEPASLEPAWHSTPSPARCTSASQWLTDYPAGPHPQSADALLRVVGEARSITRSRMPPHSFTFVQLQARAGAAFYDGAAVK